VAPEHQTSFPIRRSGYGKWGKRRSGWIPSSRTPGIMNPSYTPKPDWLGGFSNAVLRLKGGETRRTDGWPTVAAGAHLPTVARFQEPPLQSAALSGDKGMPSAFSIARARLSTLSDSTLREEIGSYTGNDAETSSILRSLRRFGEDVSISYFEVTPAPSRRSRQPTSMFSWSVRAVR